MFHSFSQWPTQRLPWIVLLFSSLSLEITALVFQYLLELEPCIMCIYQRVALFSIVLASAIAVIQPQWLLIRLVAYGGWGVGAVWGLLLAQEHVTMQSGAKAQVLSFFTCDTLPNFPSWFAIHQWLPELFEPRGDCGDINWQFLSLSMPQWMVVVFAFYTLLLAVVVLGRLVRQRRL